ncbi:DUF2993 domain-containing protein [Microcella sp.]|uniref:LmeA family phospholipid-binding protein n=1 Tax=Microcella sp. TaxID=1913979 RepID=UPI00299F628D|nr:LmeA family phospholipid-binding protein [Microcella sp.]MDX2026194.1 LmeA family phospholipid-binding protein [Microcella sp.]
MSDPTKPEASEPAADATEAPESTADATEAPEADADATATTVAEPVATESEQAPRTKRRGLVAILVLVGIVVVLGIVAVIAESIARQQASALIADQVRSTLQLEADHPVDVTIDGVSVLWQALSGRIDKVTVDAADVSFGELVGDLTLIAEGTPIDTAQPADSVQAVYRVAEADVAALAGFLAGSVVNDVQLDEREIRFQTAFSFFGVDFSVGLGVTPSAQDGQLAFTPSSVVLGDERLDAADLQQQFGPIVEPLLTSRLFCVAQYLPQALALTAVQVGDEQLVVVFGAENVALGGPEFSTLGTCS